MHCDLCAREFEPTVENPGTTYVGGYDDSHVESIHLCHEDIMLFHALALTDQHATILRLTEKAQAV